MIGWLPLLILLFAIVIAAGYAVYVVLMVDDETSGRDLSDEKDWLL